MEGAEVDGAVSALEAGGVVLLPTDTVYGLAALPGDQVAIDRLFALKGRGASAPLAVLCATADDALALATTDLAGAVAAVATRWWPGPLTLVLPRRPGVQLHLGEPVTTVGLRVPDHALVQALAARVGPIAASSANRHGLPTPATAAEAAAALGEGVALVIDGGKLEASASTVIDATTEPWRVLRAGPIDPADVLAVAAALAGDRG